MDTPVMAVRNADDANGTTHLPASVQAESLTKDGPSPVPTRCARFMHRPEHVPWEATDERDRCLHCTQIAKAAAA